MPAPNPSTVVCFDVFEPQTSTWQYIVVDPATRVAVIIGPVLDYDQTRNTVCTKHLKSGMSEGEFVASGGRPGRRRGPSP
ncbi:hypothetical protein N657DRAFT_642212, partial [Parathielavia appendiculata]